MSRWQATRILASLVLASSIAAGCSTLLPAATPESTEGGVEQLPGPAYLHLTGDPATTPRSLRISYVLPDGAVPPRGDLVEANTVLDISNTFQPGVHQVQVDGVRCTGSFELKEQVITDVVLHLADQACSTTVTGTRAEDGANPSAS